VNGRIFSTADKSRVKEKIYELLEKITAPTGANAKMSKLTPFDFLFQPLLGMKSHWRQSGKRKFYGCLNVFCGTFDLPAGGTFIQVACLSKCVK
jgi:hypothetical protein